MAAPAGIVNRTGRANDAAFNEVMSASPADIQALATTVRDLVFDVYPRTVEVVWPKQRSVGWGIGAPSSCASPRTDRLPSRSAGDNATPKKL